MIQLSIDALALLRAFQTGCLAVLIEPFKVWVFSGTEDEYCQSWPRAALTELAHHQFVRAAPDNVWYLTERGHEI